jgi:RimJ/RimL family protein N-acetyltransferase
VTPTLTDQVVILTGHLAGDVQAHLAGEDEETSRRFGWWQERSTEETVLAAYREWAAQWQSGGPTRAFAARDAVTGHLVGGCELRIQADGSGQVRTGLMQVSVARATPCGHCGCCATTRPRSA